MRVNNPVVNFGIKKVFKLKTRLNPKEYFVRNPINTLKK